MYVFVKFCLYDTSCKMGNNKCTRAINVLFLVTVL